VRIHQLRALGRDALHQVLDNWVFRILAILVLVPVLTTLVFGFRKEGIVLLFGIKTWSYEPLLRPFGYRGGVEDLQGAFIEGVLQLTFSILAGSIGVLFCIAATAFFVPRMIEKGAADVLFHKPLSRFAFYLSRYVAGLLFVGLLSMILVGGMFLGLWGASGHFDPGILWAAPSLTYLFGLIYSVSMLVGVTTRSTVATMMLSTLFFFMNGCVHSFWIGIEQAQATGIAAGGDDEAEEEGQEESNRIGDVLLAALKGLHYVLPKTTDTDYIAQKLRKSFSGPWYEDPDTQLRITGLPDGFERRDPERWEPTGAPAVRELFGTTVFAATSPQGESVELWSRPCREFQVERNGKLRDRTESSKDLADEIAELLEGGGRDVVHDILPGSPSADPRPEGEIVCSFSNRHLTWVEGDARVHLILIRRGGTLLGLEYRGPPEPAAERVHELLLGVDFDSQPDRWYERQMGWTAPWKYNIFFSVGSSVAFAALMILLGWWKLSRIDF